MKVNYKLWFKGEFESETTFGYHNTFPVIGDTIRYKDKFFKVVERVFNLNNEEYTIVHCEESDVDSLDNYK